MKHNPFATASASALTVASFYIVCRVFVGLFPKFSYSIMQAWFHGLAPQTMGSFNLSTYSFVLGLVSATVVAWLIGWCYAHCYNMFVSKGK